MVYLKSLFSFYFLIITLTPAFSTENLGECQALMGQPITSLTTHDLLHHLFVDFNQVDARERQLEFKAEEIDLENGTIIFKNPRLNNRAISFYRSECVEKKKNFLGYEICQRIGQTPIAKSLCEQLGLSSDESNEGESEIVRSNSEPFSYQYSEGEWHSLRLFSALAPPIRYPRLKTLTCKYI